MRTYVSKMILGREIPKEQAQKLLTTGKTGLLEGFISKRGRPFSAYLKVEDGKVGFEFPEKSEHDGIKIASSLTRSASSSCHSPRNK